MNWLHTWCGVVLGGLLFAIFWMGTLAVFDKEIDRWMTPMTRLESPTGALSFDAQRSSLTEAVADLAPTWNVFLPNDRTPVVRAAWFGSHGIVSRYNDPETGSGLPEPGTLAASGFLYPFHYHLHLRFMNIGLWLVGIAGMAMLVLCVSGVIVHRRIFADFFTFRPERKARRAILDLHNMVGVLGLPFHIVITLSGLIIFFNLYFPSGWIAAYGSGNLRAFNQDVYGSFSRSKSGRPGSLASLDAMAAQVRASWPDRSPVSLTVYYPGDAAAYVQINTSTSDRVTNSDATAIFDGQSGRLLYRRSELAPVMGIYRFMFGLHAIQFEHWTLRWLYFVLGLTGCTLIATGHLFWLESRRKRHAELGRSGVRIVEALTTASVSGIVLATLGLFVVNRLLPLGIANRAGIEIQVFYAIWIASFVHAGSRPRRNGWRDQAWIIAFLAFTAVALNAITTGDHLLRTLTHRYLWPVAGMDALLLLGAALAVFAALKLADVRDLSTGRKPVEGEVRRA